MNKNKVFQGKLKNSSQKPLEESFYYYINDVNKKFDLIFININNLEERITKIDFKIIFNNIGNSNSENKDNNSNINNKYGNNSSSEPLGNEIKDIYKDKNMKNFINFFAKEELGYDCFTPKEIEL